ncbi:MAG: helix-turn-helix transcriptional regulator [Victivallales bacterium]|jgi:transcriptional regulator with XRE-family HTH domain
MMTHKELKAKALDNPKVRQIYERADPEMEMLDVFLKARKISGLTQEEIARRMNTSRPVVARIEAGGAKHSPSLNTLLKYATAVGCRLKIDLVPSHPSIHKLRAHS